MKFSENRHEAFILPKLFHNYLFAITVVEIRIELFVVCQKLIHGYANFCSYC